MTRRVGSWLWTGLLGVVIFPGSVRSAAEPALENLALNKPATADSSQNDALTPSKGNDGDEETRWCPPDGETGHWWQVDLGKAETLTGARIFWEFDGRAYQYKMEGSADGKTWRMLSDQTGSKDHNQDQRLKFQATGIRHVRLTVTGLQEGWGSFWEFAVFGTKPAPAGQATTAATAQSQAAKLLKGVKVPPGWKVTLFAAPPEVHYPTCLAASPSGEVFVGIDENGSIDAKPKRGRVVRCVDGDGDGTADEFKVFAEMDSPRGIVYDASTRTLYVQHPPFITAHHDDNGDGIADREEVLVKGIGFDLSRRGADHTTNGMRLGIDGFLYIAVGDYGFVKAVGKDGATAQLHGGGIARVRLDGSGLEVYSRGQRNIYDVAVDPYLNLFTRDNTNDGGGWDVRLSHVIPTAQMGYPSLFTNFNDEIVQPLADYGGGSPCGSLYLQEPGFPQGFGDTLYTCDWGRSIVYRHPLTPNGAGFKADQVPFVEMPRPTDMDVDGTGRIYLSSWKDGGFTFSGPNVGYVIRVTPPGYEPKAFPDLKNATKEELVNDIASPSAVMREAAQREILSRPKNADFDQELVGILRSPKTSPLAVRVAALFTLSQLSIDRPFPIVTLVAKQPELLEFALRAASDRKRDVLSTLDANWYLGALTNADPRVRLQAVVANARVHNQPASPAMVRLTADRDPLVALAAINALISLKAIDACLAAIDPKTPELAPGAARALQGMHDARTVDGLIEKLHSTRDDTLRRPILKALCRLYTREAVWDGSWWSTRPDTSGPYYKAVTWDQSEKIGQALRSALGGGDDPSARFLLAEMIKNKVEIEGMTPLALKIAATDPTFRAATVGVLANRNDLPVEAYALLGLVAGSESEPPALRGRAMRGLIRALDKPAARDAAVAALASVGRLDKPPGELMGAWQDFVKDGRQARHLGDYVKIAEGPDPAPAELAYAVLLNADADPKAPGKARAVAHDAIARALAEPALTARLLQAIGLTRSQSYASQVRDRLEALNPGVRLAARDAARRLGLRGPGMDKSSGPVIAKLPLEQVLAAVQKEKGDASLGAQLFERVGCINCHTVAKTDGPKGPYLGDIANRYSRAELAESVLRPSAKIAQGFETQKIATTSGQTYEGFVVRESGDEIELRNASGAVIVLPKKEIDERGKTTVSVMPTGLADPLSTQELASILSYLESLKDKNAKP